MVMNNVCIAVSGNESKNITFDNKSEEVKSTDDVKIKRPKCPNIVYSGFSPTYILHCFWFVCMHVRIQVFIGGATSWLLEISDNDVDRGIIW